MKWVGKFSDILQKTSSAVGMCVERIVTHQERFYDLIDELEDTLLGVDLGVSATNQIITKLKKRGGWGIKPITKRDFLKLLVDEIIGLMAGSTGNFNVLNVGPGNGLLGETRVMLVCGVNGSGKTTTVGKLALRFQQLNYSIMLAGCDTFRAAASEQLSIWAERAANCPVVLGDADCDPASVVYKAMEQAKSKAMDILLVDTGGRLHNNLNLMEELRKCVRVMNKVDASAPHDTILVIDGTTGQNASSQVEFFHRAVQLSGLVITKLDGSSKGGGIVDIWHKHRVPICAIGTGEGAYDLSDFNSSKFISAMIGYDVKN